MAPALDGWSVRSFTATGITHTTYRRGEGPGVVVVHELPGITPSVRAFAEEVVAAGFTVELPSLVGRPGAPPSQRAFAASVARMCVSREFTTWATGRTSPVVDWLRALAADLHGAVGVGPGVGVIGMCFSGGFALAMAHDPVVVAPVCAQPSLPFAVGARRSGALGLSDDDRQRVRERFDADPDCGLVGLRFRDDRLVGTRFDGLRELLGDAFRAVELDGPGHSTLTEDRRDHAVAEVLAFLRDRLRGPS